MADILKVTAPLVNKNQIPSMRPSSDPTVPFNLVDTSTTKVTKLHDHKEMLSQNNTLQLQTDSSSILSGMLNDPNGSVQFLRSIYLLQEVVNLLPIANDVISEEIVSLYESLLVKPENLVDEMLRQDNASTVFRGELFDELRQLLSDVKAMLVDSTSNGLDTPPSSSLVRDNSLNYSDSMASSNTMSSQSGIPYTLNDVKLDISTLMKALNQNIIREDILKSVSNHLRYLSEEYVGLKYSSRLNELSESFHVLSEMVKDNAFNQDAMTYFKNLKQQLMAQLSEMKKSLVYSPKIEKNISILQYNLSRFGFGEEFLENSISNILKYIESPSDQAKFKELIEQYIRDRKANSDIGFGFSVDGNGTGTVDRMIGFANSRVMHALTEIVQREASGKHLMTLEQIERIVQTLLTSPSNFTPLLHFVLPIDYHGLKSFAEMWIDPNSEGESKASNEEKKLNAHVLMAMDVDGFGRFEIEAKIVNQSLNLFVYCPKDFVTAFQTIKDDISIALYQSTLKKSEVTILPLERPRTLMEVFENLPSRRTGINVSI